MAAILDFFEVAPRLNLKVRSQGIIMPKMALVSTMVTIVTLSHQTIYVIYVSKLCGMNKISLYLVISSHLCFRNPRKRNLKVQKMLENVFVQILYSSLTVAMKHQSLYVILFFHPLLSQKNQRYNFILISCCNHNHCCHCSTLLSLWPSPCKGPSIRA